MGLIRNGIYGYPVVGFGFINSLPAKPRNFAQNTLTWKTTIREYTSFPYGRFSSAFIMPLKYGGISCTMSSSSSFVGSISATASISTTLHGNTTFGGTIAGGVNLISNPQGSCTVTATPQAKGWVTCRIQIGANPTAFDVAQAVWGAVSTLYNTNGTMGAAVNNAGSAGNPWGAQLENNNTPGTFGWFIQKLLTVAKFLGLK